ncbi:MAG: hypothetical protein JKX92_16230 [Porticoccaceae bacterium]|nr:hypothetical protein [Porticoccaceae bacterium]
MLKTTDSKVELRQKRAIYAKYNHFYPCHRRNDDFTHSLPWPLSGKACIIANVAMGAAKLTNNSLIIANTPRQGMPNSWDMGANLLAVQLLASSSFIKANITTIMGSNIYSAIYKPKRPESRIKVMMGCKIKKFRYLFS